MKYTAKSLMCCLETGGLPFGHEPKHHWVDPMEKSHGGYPKSELAKATAFLLSLSWMLQLPSVQGPSLSL